MGQGLAEEKEKDQAIRKATGQYKGLLVYPDLTVLPDLDTDLHLAADTGKATDKEVHLAT